MMVLSFSRDETNDTVTDTVSNLMWQDTASVSSTTFTWDEANTYCSNLSLSGYIDWRLPTIEELISITNKSIESPNPVIYSAFHNTGTFAYWSLNTFSSDPSYVWIISFSSGQVAGFGKSIPSHLRCVRETSTYTQPVSSYTRNDNNETVYDNVTGLTWMDDTNVSLETKTWNDAIDFCETLDHAGIQDWRLPNFNELYMIAERNTSKPAIDDSTFQNTASDYYWSSTTFASDISKAWLVNFSNSFIFLNPKSNNCYVRCVYSGKTNDLPLTNKQISPVLMYMLD